MPSSAACCHWPRISRRVLGEIIRQESGRFDALRAAIVASIIALVSFVALTFRHYIRYRRQVEAALRESEEKYRGLYESSNDAVMLLDENGFLDCNDSTLHVFRVPDKQAFCGLRPQDLSPPQQPNGRDSAELADEQIKAAIRDGSNRFEWMHRRADGQLFPAEVLLSRAHFEGRPVLQAVVRDATDRKRAEELLRANEEKLRTISDAALDAVIMMDAAGRAVHWNPAAHRMFGYSAEEILGQDIHQLLTPERYREEAAAAIRGFLVNGQGRAVGQTLELQALRKKRRGIPGRDIPGADSCGGTLECRGCGAGYYRTNRSNRPSATNNVRCGGCCGHTIRNAS